MNVGIWASWSRKFLATKISSSFGHFGGEDSDARDAKLASRWHGWQGGSPPNQPVNCAAPTWRIGPQDGRKWLITMVIVSPLRIRLWDPFQMAFLWRINGGDPNHLKVLGWSSKYLPGSRREVTTIFYSRPPENQHFAPENGPLKHGIPIGNLVYSSWFVKQTHVFLMVRVFFHHPKRVSPFFIKVGWLPWFLQKTQMRLLGTSRK